MAGYGGKDSLYEVLGVYRSSSAKDIERAYRRLRAELEKDAAPPERLTLVREAHEVLSDPRKRAAYDASLKSDEFLRPESAQRATPAVKWVPIGAIAVAILVGLWLLFRSSGDGERIPAEIVAAAAPSVGRVHVIEISGRATPHANAFAIDQGVMVTTCQGFRANTQVVVKFGSRTAAAQVSRSDTKRNLCRLAAVDAGSWPLTINAAGPKAGDKAYMVSTGPTGETQLVDVKVRALLPLDGGQAIELSVPVEPTQSGGPLLDTRGRVIGVLTTQHAFVGKGIALPAAWVQEIRGAPAK
jgi:S1-C subfamily serine protease